MAEPKNESGEARQERIQHEQHRPEQNQGYDEAVHGNRPAADSDTDDGDFVAESSESQQQRDLDAIDDRAARDASATVRRRERSAG